MCRVWRQKEFLEELCLEGDVTCVWGDDEGGRVEEGGIGEDGGSEFSVVVSEVCSPSKEVLFQPPLIISVLQSK